MIAWTESGLLLFLWLLLGVEFWLVWTGFVFPNPAWLP
mgnify:CR=1 FL=1